jgi:hypothetical protein
VSKIDPTKATPQAPDAMRSSTSGTTRADSQDGDPDDDEKDEDDDEEDEDGPDSEREERDDAMASHETVRAEAEDAHRVAADAYGACKGTDSAAALMHAEDMGDAAGDAHGRAKASSMQLRGALPPGEEQALPSKAPGATATFAAKPAPVDARAVIAVAGSDGAKQARVAEAAGFGERLLALFGGGTFAAAEGIARAAHQDAADAVALRAQVGREEKIRRRREKADAEKTLVAKLRGAVRAGKYARAELFDVAVGAAGSDGKPTEMLTPKAWLKALAPDALDAMIGAKQARASSAAIEPEDKPMHVSAAIGPYAAARGYSPEYAARLAAEMNKQNGAPPRPEAT